MAMEDRLLKKNIPGKCTHWEGEESDDKGEPIVDHTDKEEESVAVSDSGPLQGRRRCTGVKGVLADFRRDQQERARQSWIERLELEEILERATRGAQLNPGELSLSAASIKERKFRSKRAMRMERAHGNSDEEDEHEHEFHEKTGVDQLEQFENENECRMYGQGVEEVDAIGYAEAVDDTDRHVMLVVHIYESFVPACRVLDRYLYELARGSMSHVRFLRLRASSALVTVDPVALPSVLIHKNGELRHNLTPVTMHLPETFTLADIKCLLTTCEDDRNCLNEMLAYDSKIRHGIVPNPAKVKSFDDCGLKHELSHAQYDDWNSNHVIDQSVYEDFDAID